VKIFFGRRFAKGRPHCEKALDISPFCGWDATAQMRREGCVAQLRWRK
jgi:hypothetical protein